MTGPDQIRDFTLRMEPKQFRIDSDVFQAPAILSPVTLAKLAKLHASMALTDTSKDVEKTLRQVGDMFKLLLPGKSGERFVERLMSDTEPIDITRQALPALYWLMEEYGLRPTEPSSPSSNGSATDSTPNDGTSSTAGASPATSTTSS